MSLVWNRSENINLKLRCTQFWTRNKNLSWNSQCHLSHFYRNWVFKSHQPLWKISGSLSVGLLKGPRAATSTKEISPTPCAILFSSSTNLSSTGHFILLAFSLSLLYHFSFWLLPLLYSLQDIFGITFFSLHGAGRSIGWWIHHMTYFMLEPFFIRKC